MRVLLSVFAAATAVFLVSREADAAVDIQVDLSTQTMRVSDHGQTYDWPVSTARSGYSTPRGVYHPVSLQTMHYSHKYDMSPMPHSIFFKGGYAIHGTYETAFLGRPASHGCVRLSAAHAALLFKMVQAQGARISISGAPPRSAFVAERIRRAAPPARFGAPAPTPFVYEPAGPVYYYGYQPGDDASPW